MHDVIGSLTSFLEPTDLLQKLVQIDTSNPPGHEEPAAELLAELMRAAGLRVTLMRFAPGRANVVGRWHGTGDRPALLFNGHLDTVPANKTDWQYDPCGAVVEDGILHGRGAVDMKGGVAAMVTACVALARANLRLAGDVIFAGTAGEEVDCAGSRHLLTEDLGPISGLVIGEPTRLEVVPAHKGALWLEITVTGKAAHGSMPEQGYNAVWAMYRLIERLLAYQPAYRAHRLLSPPTVNLGTIQGGIKTNVVPDQCVLTADLRTIVGQDHSTVIQDVQGIIDTLRRQDPAFRATLRVVNDCPPVDTSTEEPLIQIALRVGREVFDRSLSPKGMSYFTDASVLAPRLRVPTLIIGPGDERLAHQANERTELSAVRMAARFYMTLAQSFLSR